MFTFFSSGNNFCYSLQLICKNRNVVLLSPINNSETSRSNQFPKSFQMSHKSYNRKPTSKSQPTLPQHKPKNQNRLAGPSTGRRQLHKMQTTPPPPPSPPPAEICSAAAPVSPISASHR